LWFTLTEPTADDSRVLWVNLTTLDDECPDDECLIDSSEYGWVDHPTAVAFSRARLWNADKIVSAISSGILKKPRQGDIPRSTIAKVLSSAARSRELSRDLKDFL
jgi:hypothetical protein